MAQLAASGREPLFTPSFFRVFAFSFFTFFSAFQLFPAIPFRIIDLGGTKAEAGFFLAVYTYACAFSAPLTGSLADHFGRKRLLGIAASMFIIFSLLYGIVSYLPLLLLIACIHGMFWSAILSSSAAIMSEIIPVSRRTEGIAYWGMASTAAVAVAPLVGLIVYRKGWLILCVEMAALSAFMLYLSTRIEGGTSVSVGSFPRLKEIVDFRVVATGMALFVVSFGYGGITSYVAVMAVERQILPSSLFFTVFAVTILLTRIFTSPVGDRFGPKRLLYPSLLVLPFALMFLAVADSQRTIIASAIVYGTGFGGAYPAFVTFVLARTSPLRRAATFGSILWAFDTGIGTGSLVTGILAHHFGFRLAFTAAGLISIAAIPIFLFTSRLLPDEAALAPSASSKSGDTELTENEA